MHVLDVVMTVSANSSTCGSGSVFISPGQLGLQAVQYPGSTDIRNADLSFDHNLYPKAVFLITTLLMPLVMLGFRSFRRQIRPLEVLCASNIFALAT